MNSLYIHIPFCEKKCFYCSFVISVGQEKRIDQYIECLSEEASFFKGVKVDSVHLGGGTPSMLQVSQLTRLANMIKSNFVLDGDKEFAIEVNPETIDGEKARALKSSGFNRVSLGAQTFQDKYLQYLGRNHSAESISRTFGELRDAGFKNINIDLIYALAGQTFSEVTDDLLQLRLLGSEHASLYALTVEEQSLFFSKKISPMPTEQQAAFFKLVPPILEKAGLMQYEVSNFSKPGFESAHNMNYWLGGNYIGLGVGAHSHQDGHRWWNTGRLIDYIRQIKETGQAKQGEEILLPQKRLCEAIVFGLRMNTGINLGDIQERFQEELEPQKKEKLEMFFKNGLLDFHNGRLKVSLKGRLLLDEISSYLV